MTGLCRLTHSASCRHCKIAEFEKTVKQWDSFHNNSYMAAVSLTRLCGWAHQIAELSCRAIIMIEFLLMGVLAADQQNEWQVMWKPVNLCRAFAI